MTSQRGDRNSDPADPLRDIVDACQKAIAFTAGTNLTAFSADEKTIFAVVRALEIIGEATKRVPDVLRARYQHVPWRAMAGIRDRLIHHYERVDAEVVWKTVQDDLPKLAADIERLLLNLERHDLP